MPVSVPRLLANTPSILAENSRPLLYPGVNCESGFATIAEINAGLSILKFSAGGPVKIRILDFVFRADTSFANLTSVELETDEDTPTVIVSLAVANILDAAYLREGDTGVTVTEAAFLITLAANAGLQITKTGSDEATGVGLYYAIYYQILEAPGLVSI